VSFIRVAAKLCRDSGPPEPGLPTPDKDSSVINNFKAYKGNKDIVKKAHVTAVVQP